ncbi:MAG: UDP-N-acetylmuramoyl-tripeptide--D-alanyl-D-alanine ligase [Candidatus Euphemobacter frigidus]|nr:UDP-N-acetylmuramoyl-tripeptide--D-alanyl-D-alanine ligase [Candidatus Euphemobacter frigidus]MDP8275865.1 UDP-N-acetylmuramoyl-tripeptide--D-alanyl-D-alanine ligase [Candidatus Euphemobacter frigidus]
MIGAMESQELQTITDWTGGSLLKGDPSARVAGISTDSRRVRPGELFLALRGERFDGHDFAAAALSKGAAGVILDHPVPEIDTRYAGKALIRVEDTLQALAGLARGYRALFDILAVAVTGSNGKTTTKNLIGRLLDADMKTLTAPASYNNLIGVSLTVLRIERNHQAVVFEVGMNRPGEIGELGEICRPRIAVVTNVGPAHIGNLGSLEKIAREKAELFKSLEGEKTAFLNIDDHRVRAMARSAPGPVIGFGFDPSAQVRASNLSYLPDGVKFDLNLADERMTIHSPLPGRYNVYNLLAALGVADHLHISPARMKEAISKADLPSQRMEEVVIEGVLLIDDAYNANPASMRAALDSWLMMKVKGRRVMVSGDMHELGEFSRAEHQAWGEELGESALDYLIFLGPWSRYSARAAEEKGFPDRRIFAVDDSQTVAELLRGILQPGDSVLIKGSRVMKMEEIVERLKGSTTYE